MVYILPLNLYAAQVDELREQAIHTYKTGQTQQAILKLDQLLNKYPHDQKLLADYLVVMSSEKKDLLTFSQHLANINYVTFPEYGQLPLIRNLRDFKHFKDAIEWSNKFNIHKTSDGQILLAVLYAEAQDPVNAKVHLTSIKNKNLTAEQFVQIAYAYRLINSPVDALSVIEQAYQQQPNSFAVLQEYSYDLAAVGSYKKAQQLLLASDKNAQTEALQHWLKVSEFSQRGLIISYRTAKL